MRGNDGSCREQKISDDGGVFFCGGVWVSGVGLKRESLRTADDGLKAHASTTWLSLIVEDWASGLPHPSINADFTAEPSLSLIVTVGEHKCTGDVFIVLRISKSSIQTTAVISKGKIMNGVVMCLV